MPGSCKSTRPSPDPPRRARIATFAAFGLNGFLFGLWVVHIPVAERRTGIGHATLGWLLLLLSLAALAGMRVCGRLADRFGSRVVVTGTGLLFSVAVLGPAAARSALALAAALAAFGLVGGGLDVSMNAHAVAVERGYRRPIMSAFHAAFSLGGVVAGVAGAAALRHGFGIRETSLGGCALGLAVTAMASPWLLRAPPASTAGPARPAGPGRQARPGLDPAAPVTGGRVRSLGTLAFLLMLAEGAAYDWATVDLRDVLGARPATAALGYGAFATAMTLGRLGCDRLAGRFGAVRVLRYGCVFAAAGLAAAVLTRWLPVALAGWAAFGIGLAGGVPQVFTAAGNMVPGAAAVNLSRVAGAGYAGLLAGPAVIGTATRVIPLNVALLLPVCCCLAAVRQAKAVAKPR